MAGVIDDNGVQWERCSCCGKFTRLANMGYLKPSENFKYGLDLCLKCTNVGIEKGLYNPDDLIPSTEWTIKE